MKVCYVYNKQATWTILGGIGGLFCLVAGMDVWFLATFGARGEPLTAILLCLFITVPAVLMTVYLYKIGLFQKYLLRYRFDRTGIHCSGLTWGKFCVDWSSIRTYGFVVSSGNYAACPIIVFSQKPNETWVSGIYELRRDRLIVEYEKDKWEAIERCLPDDMKGKLKKSIDEFKVGYYRR